jgi:hypothetical protein
MKIFPESRLTELDRLTWAYLGKLTRLPAKPKLLLDAMIRLGNNPITQTDLARKVGAEKPKNGVGGQAVISQAFNYLIKNGYVKNIGGSKKGSKWIVSDSDLVDFYRMRYFN